MKKAILKVFGVAALAAGMMYNVQVFNAENGSGISLPTLGNTAVAQSEGGGRNGKALAQGSSGRYCCAKTSNPSNNCTSAPDC